MSEITRLPIGASVTPCTAPEWTGPCCGVRLDSLDECFRPAGHEGRHACIGTGGEVFKVWGDDVHAAKRAKGRCSTCEGTGRVMWEPFAHRDSEEPDQPCPDCTERRDS